MKTEQQLFEEWYLTVHEVARQISQWEISSPELVDRLKQSHFIKIDRNPELRLSKGYIPPADYEKLQAEVQEIVNRRTYQDTYVDIAWMAWQASRNATRDTNNG